MNIERVKDKINKGPGGCHRLLMWPLGNSLMDYVIVAAACLMVGCSLYGWDTARPASGFTIMLTLLTLGCWLSLEWVNGRVDGLKAQASAVHRIRYLRELDEADDGDEIVVPVVFDGPDTFGYAVNAVDQLWEDDPDMEVWFREAGKGVDHHTSRMKTALLAIVIAAVAFYIAGALEFKTCALLVCMAALRVGLYAEIVIAFDVVDELETLFATCESLELVPYEE